MNFNQAAQLAAAWVKITSEGRARIVREYTVTRPSGWVFCYRSNEFLDNGTPGTQLVGNAPILVERVNSELRVFGSAQSIDYYLQEYEKSIPVARLQMPIELPTW